MSRFDSPHKKTAQPQQSFASQQAWMAHAVSSSLFSDELKQKLSDALSTSLQTESTYEPGIEEADLLPPDLAQTSKRLQAEMDAVSKTYGAPLPTASQKTSGLADKDKDASNTGSQQRNPLDFNANGSVCGTTNLNVSDESRLQANLAPDSPVFNNFDNEEGFNKNETLGGNQLASLPKEMLPDIHHPTNRLALSTDLKTDPKKSEKVLLKKNLTTVAGGTMADLSGYKDLSKAPLSLGADDDLTSPSLGTGTLATGSLDRSSDRAPSGFSEREVPHFDRFTMPTSNTQSHGFGDVDHDVDTEFSGNVKTLIRLVNELPQDVTKQTGAQIIRLTMEAMGISMEDVLSEAQSAQSEMLDAVRANIKKIEEYKTVIRKLETDIKYYQGKANELSEIIDLFILSNTASGSSLDSSGY